MTISLQRTNLAYFLCGSNEVYKSVSLSLVLIASPILCTFWVTLTAKPFRFSGSEHLYSGTKKADAGGDPIRIRPSPHQQSRWVSPW